MKTARRRVFTAFLLFLLGLGASASAAAITSLGWLVLVAYLIGALTAWFLFGTLMAYAQTRARTRLLGTPLGGRRTAAPNPQGTPS